MIEWFNELSTFESIYWVVAAVSSLIFIVLLFLTLIGGDVDEMGDVDAEIDADTGIDFQLFSFKNLVGFFTLFGWTGIACIQNDASVGLTIIVSVVCGLLMMFSMAALFYYLAKLQSSGTLQLKNALNAVGEVYLTIGAKRSNIGKVQIQVQGTLREMEALTDEEEDLKHGNVVKVVDFTPNGILIVKQLNN